MAAHIAMAMPSAKTAPDEQGTQPKYWSAENHQADAGNTYLRAEEWLKDVQEFTLPVPHTQVKVTLPMGQAILRYREELKMYACLEDAAHPERSVDAMDDAEFLDRHQARIKTEWPTGGERASWWAALEALRQQLDEAIARVESDADGRVSGAFVKFSVRSPKDAAGCTSNYRALIAEHVHASSVGPDDEEALSADVAAIKHAAWMALRVHSGEQAVQLFVRSDRIYLDVMQHELFSQRGTFDLSVHVFGFFTGFDPDYEFRAFCADGQRTAITAYNPWVFDRRMIANKDALLQRMLDLWDRVAPRVRSRNYSLDFAVAPDLSACWIVEINNFLPPLAGSGLFDWYDAADRHIVTNGPFEFRIRTRPVTDADFVRVKPADPDADKPAVTIVMQPAAPPVMAYVRNLRRAKAGLPPLPVLGDASDKTDASETADEDQSKCALQ